MDEGRGIWNDQRELTNIGVIWVLAWNLVLWLLLVPILIGEPSVPAFFAYGLLIGSIIWAVIGMGGAAPGFLLILRARRLRDAASPVKA